MGQQPNGTTDIDWSAILTEIYARNRLRIEAQLPRLNIKAELEHAVLVRAWRQHLDRQHDRVRSEILAAQRARHGEGYGLSWGGRMALNVLTRRALEASFRWWHPEVGEHHAVSPVGSQPPAQPQ